MEKHNKLDYINIQTNEQGSIYISCNAIRNSVLHYLGEQPTEDVRFVKNASFNDRALVQNDNNQLSVKINITIKKNSSISNNIYLIQEKIKAAIIETTNLIPKIINVSIINYYDSD